MLDREMIRAYEVIALTPNAVMSVTRFRNPIYVCLLGTGVFLYRDANNAPRVVTELPSSAENGFTCASVPHAGTIVLVKGTPSITAPSEVIKTLSDCTVITKAIVNLRQRPDLGSKILALVPYNVTLKATARQGDWLQVVYRNDQGWLAASFLTLEGSRGP